MKFRGCAKIRGAKIKGAKIKGARKLNGIRYALFFIPMPQSIIRQHLCDRKLTSATKIYYFGKKTHSSVYLFYEKMDIALT